MSKPPRGLAALSLQPGALVAGRYRIVSNLGEQTAGLGAPSGTYSAIDLASGSGEQAPPAAGHTVVTLRILPDRGSSGEPYGLSEEERLHFAQQAEHCYRLQHPSVARTFELGLHEDLGVVLAREPVEPEGQTLRDVLAVRGGPLPEAEAVQLCAQIGEALEAAHQQGVYHLGLSPSCVFVFPDGQGVRVKVADFGLLPPAWAARVGEPGYLAPEQVDVQVGGQAEAKLDGQSGDRRTDQFALAVILYEMLAGQPAFVASAAEDRQIILGRVRNEDPLPLSQSRAVEQALARALSRSRAVRFPSVRDFVRALGGDVSGWPSGRALPAQAEPPPRPRTPRLLLPMAAGAIFSLVGFGGFVLVRQLTGATPRGAVADLGPGPLQQPLQQVDQQRGELAERRVTDLALAREATVAAIDGGAVAAAEVGDTADEPQVRGNPPPATPVRPGRPSSSDAAVQRPDGPSPGSMASPAGSWSLTFSGPEAGALTAEQRAELTSCVRMISPRPPFQVVVENINDLLYVDPSRSSPQLSSSQDFRDCLKLRVKGKIVPKVFTITRTTKEKGKAAP